MKVTADEFWAQFSQLSPPKGDVTGSSFSIGPVTSAYMIGRNHHDLPCLLIRCSDTDGLVTPRLMHLRIRPGADCELIAQDGTLRKENLTIVEPVDVSLGLSRFLVGSFHSVMVAAGPQPRLEDLQRLVSEIADVFRGLGALSGSTAQGLWSELFTIWCCADPVRAAEAWHRDFEEKWDFVDGLQRLEIKSGAAASDRRHHFTLEQVCPPEGVSVFVVSMTTARGSGLSIGELVDRLRKTLGGSPDVLSRLEQTVAAALGETAEEMLQLSYDEEVARESIRLYEAGAVPKPPCEQAIGVGRVEFISDLDFAAWMSVDAILENDGLVAELGKSL